ncbi:tripartite tricarboxylate transporter TctB family protein [Pseudorhodobacter aquimaris]|uniref:tripartite tricarboxylate transporter TctB family protein n=1 Tax=Pseudorhodobacter aquimaris TaxID=687412 RepID=UPI00067BBA80|nr:tripartite tricarboxylate transporter TctB family protein [Pseudorhodobacter aquimaris]
MKRDIPDLAGGAILAAIGLFIVIYAAVHYDMGSVRRMGPGFFPAMLGGVLAVLGLVIAVPAWMRAGQETPIAWKDALAVLVALLVFAAGVERGGLVPVTVATVLIASIAAPDRRLGWRVLLAVVVTLLSVLVFHYGLRMTVPLWPS